MNPPRQSSKGRSRRPILIFAILLASLVLISALGWESWQLIRSNSRAADSVLKDYGMQAADEFSRRFTKSLGYFGYFAIIEQCDDKRSAEQMLWYISNNDMLRDAAGIVSSYFWHDGMRLSIAGERVSADLDRLISDIQRNSPDVDELYHSARLDLTGEQVVYAIRTALDGTREVCGFVMNSAGLINFARRALDSGPLLPTTHTGGAVENSQLFIELRDSLGETLFKINPQFDSHLTVDKSFVDDSMSDGAGYMVRISIDPLAVHILVSEGVPKTRLPWLLAILATAILLLVAAIWLFRREQAVLEMRQDFVSQVSHELRTPLTQIRMFAETLLLGRTRSAEERQRSLSIIDRESQRLSHLVENILLASKVSDAIQLDCQTQRLTPILLDVCNSMQSTNAGVKIEMSFDEKSEACVDADALRQIVLNLLDNAIKYGPDAQTVNVVLRDIEGRARLNVTDQGPGIPEVENERVWDEFYRLRRERKTAISGTGIGLSVVRKLCQRMGGQCWIDSSSSGTCVSVEFAKSEGNG